MTPMDWVPWTERSEHIPFKSERSGEGDGEAKVASELGTKPLGQNSPYDLNLAQGCRDVKKLDVDGSFNTGKEGRIALLPHKMRHMQLLEIINAMYKNDIFTSDEQYLLSQLKDVHPDEMAVGTLKKLNEACDILHRKLTTFKSGLPTVSVTVGSITLELSIDKIPREFPLPEEHIDKIKIIKFFDHEYINDPKKMMNDLDGLVKSVFQNVKPIAVDKTKGYMNVEDISRIKFQRITRGYPRFKVIF